jgi:hypothetical protein
MCLYNETASDRSYVSLLIMAVDAEDPGIGEAESAGRKGDYKDETSLVIGDSWARSHGHGCE